MRILLFSQNEQQSQPLKRVFSYSGFHTDVCLKEDRLLYLSMVERYAAVVAQVDLDEAELSQLYASWKQQGCTAPFIVITPRQSGLQRARLLQQGIDFYFIQPYSYTRLASTILLKEYKDHTIEQDCYRTVAFEVDILRRTIYCTGQLVYLTKTEFDILSFLIRYKGIVLSRLQIWEEVWGYEDFPLTNSVDVHINRLRKKLPPPAQKYVTTVHGIGYRLSADA